MNVSTSPRCMLVKALQTRSKLLSAAHLLQTPEVRDRLAKRWLSDHVVGTQKSQRPELKDVCLR